jgi:predicted  nucleic acid-binding Zn-ribbon protein
MAKTREQRTKELTKPSAVVKAWSDVKGKFKELDAPIFKKLGDIAGSAKDYDAATKAFLDAVKRKNGVAKVFNDAGKDVASASKRIDDLRKQVDGVLDDEKVSYKLSGGTDAEDYLEAAENAVKTQQDLNKERAAIFDNLEKAYDALLKAFIDCQDKVQKELDAANADLDSANKDIESAEQDIRKIVRTYYATALDMNRTDIGTAVNKLLAEFGK